MDKPLQLACISLSKLFAALAYARAVALGLAASLAMFVGATALPPNPTHPARQYCRVRHMWPRALAGAYWRLAHDLARAFGARYVSIGSLAAQEPSFVATGPPSEALR